MSESIKVEMDSVSREIRDLLPASSKVYVGKRDLVELCLAALYSG
jgi:hypothetical protein